MASNKRDEPDRKERVLHTRVPAVLEEELKRLAGSLRVPISNVVRTILEDAVSAADAVGRVAEDELRGVARRLEQQRTRLSRAAGGKRTAPLAGVLGFQPLVLALDAECAVCGRALRAGENAFLGVRDGAAPSSIVGPECLPRKTGEGR
jgi:hypothetical protein